MSLCGLPLILSVSLSLCFSLSLSLSLSLCLSLSVSVSLCFSLRFDSVKALVCRRRYKIIGVIVGQFMAALLGAAYKYMIAS